MDNEELLKSHAILKRNAHQLFKNYIMADWKFNKLDFDESVIADLNSFDIHHDNFIFHYNSTETMAIPTKYLGMSMEEIYDSFVKKNEEKTRLNSLNRAYESIKTVLLKTWTIHVYDAVYEIESIQLKIAHPAMIDIVCKGGGRVTIPLE